MAVTFKDLIEGTDLTSEVKESLQEAWEAKVSEAKEQMTAEGQYVALRGRVPCKVIGPVAKGDVLVTSSRPGFAQRADDPHFVGVACYVGKAISSIDTPSEGVIEIMV